MSARLGAVTGKGFSDLFAGHPYNFGICGGFATEPISDLIAESDCVLAVGASLNGFTTRRGELMAGKRIVHCDVDASAFYRHERPEVALFGDAKLVADALSDLVASAWNAARSNKITMMRIAGRRPFAISSARAMRSSAPTAGKKRWP